MAYYVPKSNIRLFYPRVFFDEQNDWSYHMAKNTTTLTLGDKTPMVFSYQPGKNLPMMLKSSHFNNPTTSVCLIFEDTTNMLAKLTVANEVKQNLTAAKKELLMWLWKLGRADMQHVQILIQTLPETSSHEQLVPPPHVKTASSCDHSLCDACRFAKPTRCNPGTIQSVDLSNRYLSHGDLQPGSKVSIDRYISGIPAALLIQDANKTRIRSIMAAPFLSTTVVFTTRTKSC
jgi:hypothetical protein